MASNSNPATPISFRPPGASTFSEVFDDDGHAWGNAVVGHPGESQSQTTSPTAKRGPTFRDYDEKIKHLQQENFQLRVRVFLSEQKSGIKTSSADFADFFQQHKHKLQDLLNVASHSTSSISVQSTNDLVSSGLVSNLKVKNEKLTSKVQELEQKIYNFELALADKQEVNRRLAEQNDQLTRTVEELEAEFSLSKLHQEKEAASINYNSDEEIEKGARIAFGLYTDEEMQSCKRDFETRLAAETARVHDLERKLGKMKKDFEKAVKTISYLEKDKQESDAKFIECSKALMEFGKRNVKLTERIEQLQLQNVQNYSLSADMKNGDSIVTIVERYNSIREVVGLLQDRIIDIIKFVEAMLNLESKKIVTLTGLKDEDRANLRQSMQHCQMLSQSLTEMFEVANDADLTNRRLNLAGLSLHPQDGYRSFTCDRSDAAGDTETPSASSLMKKALNTIAIQCNIVTERPKSHGGPPTPSTTWRLQRDLEKCEKSRQKLVQEKVHLLDQISYLEPALRACHEQIASLEKSTHALTNQTIEALEMEKNSLTERLFVSESAMRRLHQEHAKLVSELKIMRCLTGNDQSNIGFMVSERPLDAASPDLGIDSGHDGAVNSDDSNGKVINYKSEYKILRNTNRELGQKLRQTRAALDKTMDRLNQTTKQKEQVEKAICRQLHKTHTILRQAKKSVEKYANNQGQENIVPSANSEPCASSNDN